MVELIGKPIITEKRVSQEMLEQYNVMDLLSGIGYVELALLEEKYNEKLIKEFYANLSKDFSNTERPTYGQVYVRGISLTSPMPIFHTT